jgi:hypothetical protein
VSLHPLNPSWNLEVWIFADGGKAGEPMQRKTLEARERTNK